MSWKKNPASGWKLYCIVDSATQRSKDPVKSSCSLFADGADILQLRYKNYPSGELVRIAKKIQQSRKKRGKTLLINDRVDVALASGADGVHVGEGDFSTGVSRRLLGSSSVIGKTVHSAGEAKRAACCEIDYVSAGPIFSTPLKRGLKARGPRFIKKIKKCVSVPVFAIGGINKKNVKAVLRGGAYGICVLRGAKRAKELLKACKKAT